MSIHARITLVSGLPGAVALALVYLSAHAHTATDGRRLFWYAVLLASLGSMWGLVVWVSHRTRTRAEIHEDEISDLRCQNRRLENDLDALSHAMAALLDTRAPGYLGVPIPAGRRRYDLPGPPDGHRGEWN